jgi:hypothetical protein
MVTCLFRAEMNISVNSALEICFLLYHGLQTNFMVYHPSYDWSSNYHAYTFSEAYLSDSEATMNGQNPCSSHESKFFRNRLLLFSPFVLLILFRFIVCWREYLFFFERECSSSESAHHFFIMHRIVNLLQVVMTAEHNSYIRITV